MNNMAEDQRKESELSQCEVIAVVSGKGGTGKTFIAACLAYALQNAGKRVCLIDTDFATQGLSLFILGRAAERGSSHGLQEENSLYHMVAKWGPKSRGLPVPMEADRRGKKDHGLSYPIIISNKQFYDKRYSLGVEAEAKIAEGLLKESMSEVTDKFRKNYRSLLKSLFEKMRSSGDYDYIIVDTRGGFGEVSLIPAAFSNSFFVVSEPDFTSFHQLAKLLANIDLMCVKENRRPFIRGLIVNKATEEGEEKFRSLLDAQFGIDLGLSWPIPLDAGVVNTYKEQLIPYRISPGLVFCSATLDAFTESFDLVTAKWSQESKEKWRSLANIVEEAREVEKMSKINDEQEAIATRQRLEEALDRAEKAESQVRQAKDKIDQYEKAELERTDKTHVLEIGFIKKITWYRAIIVILGILLILTLVFSSFFYKFIMDDARLQLEKYAELEKKYEELKTSYEELDKEYIASSSEHRRLIDQLEKYVGLEEKYEELKTESEELTNDYQMLKMENMYLRNQLDDKTQSEQIIEK
jgi:MinD-like ATPase involved in chromosome partitioning or flagellar assembly